MRRQEMIGATKDEGPFHGNLLQYNHQEPPTMAELAEARAAVEAQKPIRGHLTTGQKVFAGVVGGALVLSGAAALADHQHASAAGLHPDLPLDFNPHLGPDLHAAGLDAFNSLHLDSHLNPALQTPDLESLYPVGPHSHQGIEAYLSSPDLASHLSEPNQAQPESSASHYLLSNFGLDKLDKVIVLPDGDNPVNLVIKDAMQKAGYAPTKINGIVIYGETNRPIAEDVGIRSEETTTSTSVSMGIAETDDGSRFLVMGQIGDQIGGINLGASHQQLAVIPMDGLGIRDPQGNLIEIFQTTDGSHNNDVNALQVISSSGSLMPVFAAEKTPLETILGSATPEPATINPAEQPPAIEPTAPPNIEKKSVLLGNNSLEYTVGDDGIVHGIDSAVRDSLPKNMQTLLDGTEMRYDATNDRVILVKKDSDQNDPANFIGQIENKRIFFNWAILKNDLLLAADKAEPEDISDGGLSDAGGAKTLKWTSAFFDKYPEFRKRGLRTSTFIYERTTAEGEAEFVIGDAFLMPDEKAILLCGEGLEIDVMDYIYNNDYVLHPST